MLIHVTYANQQIGQGKYRLTGDKFSAITHSFRCWQ